MDERIRFVLRLKDGESMAALCREFQISRKTGYKIFERYVLTTGAPGGTRTPGLLVRSQSLYPAELRARSYAIVTSTTPARPPGTGVFQNRT